MNHNDHHNQNDKEKNKERILIVDDDKNVCKSLEFIFGKKGYDTETAYTGQDAINIARDKFFNIALLDINLPDMGGIDLIAPLKEMHPDTAVIMVTGYASVENAVQALNEGAAAYNIKPLNMDEVLATIENVVEKQRLMFEKRQVEDALRESQEMLSSFINSATDIFVLFDPELDLVEVNKAGLKTWAVNKDEIIGKNLLEISPNLNKIGRTREYQKVMKTGKPFSFDDLVLHPKLGDKHLAVKAFRMGNGLGMVINDITERKRAEKELLESNERFSNFIEFATDGFYLWDSKFNLVKANKIALDMLGKNKDEALGKHMLELIPKFKDTERYHKYREVFKTGKSCFLEDFVSLPNFKKMYLNMKVFRSGNDLGIIVRDVTESKLGVEDQKRLTAELAQKNKELGQIVYVTSHDLRSPLVNAQGFSKELELSLNEITKILNSKDIPTKLKEKITPILEEDIAEAIQYILSSITKMDSLLSGLLKLSRLGRSEFSKEQIDMNELLTEISDTFEYQVKSTDIKLEISELPDCIGDKDQINQVFSNLIDNALKYLDPKQQGKIKISGYNEKGNTIYCIEDNGIGIAKEHQNEVFEIFHQLDPSITNGEGLGLTIVRKVLDKHGGKVWLESEPDKGSTFYISLPGVEK